MQRNWNAEAALAERDLAAAHQWADEAVSTTTGFYLVRALTTRARVAIAQGEPEQAEHDAHDALARAAEMQARAGVVPTSSSALAPWPRTLVVTAKRPGCSVRHTPSGNGSARSALKITTPATKSRWRRLRDAIDMRETLTPRGLKAAALSIEEAIAYAQRGRGERKRPASGWAALTPTERDVVRLVSEGLANNDIATRLFVSHRTVQSHLTHVYTKLGLSSRVQLAQEAARHT